MSPARPRRGQRWVVFLRGVNVGGHRRFRPSLLAQRLARWQVTNVGAAGTFVVMRPVAAPALRGAIRRCLPFETTVVLCPLAQVQRLAASDPFAGFGSRRDVVQFVSVLESLPATRRALPRRLPDSGAWLVRILERRGRYVIGLHRRRMQAIAALGRFDKLLGTPATTRSWSTLRKIAEIAAPR